MTSNESRLQPQFEPIESPPGVRLVDRIDGGEFTLLTATPFDPIPRETVDFPVPVDAAVSAPVEQLQTPYLIGLWIRDEEFTLLEPVSGGDKVSMGSGRYIVEFSSVQLKVYLFIEGAFDVDATGDQMTFSLESETTIQIGIRSYHEQPARTISITRDPRDAMHAISQFRSALKTTSPEHSFPTLRGHPPLVELGDSLSIPGGELAQPSMSIEVPPRWDQILPVVSLAYYLDAAVVPGMDPRLIVDGRRIPLVGEDGFEERVEQILKHVFALDAVTRTEGLYDVDLHERSVIEDRIQADFDTLYELPFAERVRTYLDIPFDVVEPAYPEWKLTADVEPHASNAPVLPFLANDLAIVRVPTDADLDTRGVAEPSPDVDQFFHDDRAIARGSSEPSQPERDEQRSVPSDRIFRPEPTDSLMQTFVGSGIPMGATKMNPEAFRRRLDHKPAESGRIRVDVVTNEAAMRDEMSVSEVYGAREWVDFDVSIHEELSREELADVLQSGTDFFHYIGHVEDDGFRCREGHLDARTLSSVDVGAFLLNACNSYEQGQALVDAGALGGIVTLATIPNPTASGIGKNLARLLNTGFSIATARSILERDEQLANRYMVIGDGHANVVESTSGGPMLFEINTVSGPSVNLNAQGYPSSQRSIGGLRDWNVEMPVAACVSPLSLTDIDLPMDEFERLCRLDQHPIVYNNELLWSDEIDVSHLKDRT